MVTLTDEQYQEKSKHILNAILEGVNGCNVPAGIALVAGPVTFFLMGCADMMGTDRSKVINEFFKHVKEGADYAGEIIE